MTTTTNIEAVNSGQTEREAFKEFRAALCRMNGANTPVSVADRVMILSNATFLLDEYERAAASAQPVAQTLALSDEQKKQIAAIVHRDCTLIPGANFYTAAELAIQATVAQLNRALLASKPAVPEGWKLVPLEPTEKMIDAAQRYTWLAEEDATESGIWRHMLAAAPTAPASPSGEPGMTNGDFHCPACGSVLKGPTACGSCLWERDTCGYALAASPSGEDAANGAMGEREAFEAHMRSRDETYLYRRDTPGSTRLGQYCRQSVQDQWEAWQARAALTAEKVAGKEAVKDAAPAQSGEPIDLLLDRLKNGEDYTAPLYTAPQPSQPAQSGEQDERAALLRKIRITCEARFVKMGDDYALGANQVARDVVRLLDHARAASTQSTATQPVQTERALTDIEQYRMQMAAISAASFGYWKEGDDIHPDCDTLTLRDVSKLYAKYAIFRETLASLAACVGMIMPNCQWTAHKEARALLDAAQPASSLAEGGERE